MKLKNYRKMLLIFLIILAIICPIDELSLVELSLFTLGSSEKRTEKQIDNLLLNVS
jgi:hypothetical protein